MVSSPGRFEKDKWFFDIFKYDDDRGSNQFSTLPEPQSLAG